MSAPTAPSALEERRLTFGEHLEELRSHVIRALLFLAISVTVCMLFQETLMRVVLWPQQRIGTEGREERLVRAAAELEAVLADIRARPVEGRTAAEVEALGRRLDVAFSRALGGPDRRLNFLAPQEAFLAYLKVAFICGLFIASPLISVELWRFVAEGLYAHEQKYVRIFGPFSFLLFAMGVLFGYFILIPTSLQYLENYASTDLLVASITLDGYLDLFLALTLAVGLIFEIPLVLVFLAAIGLVSSGMLSDFRRYFIFIATVLAAVITPTGDPLTLAIVAVPIFLLYEVGIAAIKLLVEKGHP